VIQVMFSYVLIAICLVLLAGGLGLVGHGVFGLLSKRQIKASSPEKPVKKGKESLEEIHTFRRTA